MEFFVIAIILWMYKIPTYTLLSITKIELNACYALHIGHFQSLVHITQHDDTL